MPSICRDNPHANLAWPGLEAKAKFFAQRCWRTKVSDHENTGHDKWNGSIDNLDKSIEDKNNETKQERDRTEKK